MEAMDEFLRESAKDEETRTFATELVYGCVERRDELDAQIAAAIIIMAHQLKLKVVAEGVEQEEQLRLLQTQGCDVLQGYLFSRPLPADEITLMLKEKRTLDQVVGPPP